MSPNLRVLFCIFPSKQLCVVQWAVLTIFVHVCVCSCMRMFWSLSVSQAPLKAVDLEPYFPLKLQQNVGSCCFIKRKQEKKCQSITREDNTAGWIIRNVCTCFCNITTNAHMWTQTAYYLLSVSTMAWRPGYSSQTSPGTIPVNSQQS